MRISKVTYFFPPNVKQIDQSCFERTLDFKQHQRLVGTTTLYQSEIGTTGSDLGLEAAKAMLKNIDPQYIDFLIFSSLTLDFKAPTSASIIHQKLGLKTSCGAIDLPLGCSAFTSALALSNGFFKTGNMQRILIVLGEVPSQAVDSDDASVRNLFGDAGVAVLVEPSENPFHFVFGNDGEGIDYLKVSQGGSRFPFNFDYLNANKNQPHLNQFGKIEMEGQGILKMTLKHIPVAIRTLLNSYNLKIEDIDYFIFHQGSKILLDAISRKMEIPSRKIIDYMALYGNTVSCSIPLAWYFAEKDGLFKSGDRILCLGFGVGFSWSGTIIHYS